MSFGTRLRELRKANGYTQETLAKALGVTKGAVGNYETDASSPKEEILLKIFNTLNAEPNYLFQDNFNVNELVLDSEQQLLLDKYRNTDDYGRESIMFTAEREYKRLQAQKQESSPVKIADISPQKDGVFDFREIARDKNGTKDKYRVNSTAENMEKMKLALEKAQKGGFNNNEHDL